MASVDAFARDAARELQLIRTDDVDVHDDSHSRPPTTRSADSAAHKARRTTQTSSSYATLAASGMTAALWAVIGGAPDVDRADWRNVAPGSSVNHDDDIDDMDEIDVGERDETASAARRRAAKAFASTSDVELYAARCALARLTQTESRAIMSAALVQWKLACGRRVANARVARATGHRARRRVLRRYFNRWCVQIPMTTVVGHMGWNDRRGAERSTYIAGLVNGTADGNSSDEEFPVDYRAELEIRLTQISRLEEALKAANVKAERAMGEADVDAQMDKFRAHLNNVQRELENVKRERDMYKAKYAAAIAATPGAKSQAERRMNQRTMSTQTTFTSDDGERDSKPAPPREPTAKEVKAIETQWMGTAQQFQKKFERQMEISNDLEKRLREERTRLMKTEAKYEAQLDEMRAKHDAAIAEVFSRTTTENCAGATDVSREAFEAYAAIGKRAGVLTPAAQQRSPEPQPMIRSSSIDMFRTSSNEGFAKSPRPLSSTSDAAGADIGGGGAASTNEFQETHKLNFSAALDDDDDDGDEDDNAFGGSGDNDGRISTDPVIQASAAMTTSNVVRRHQTSTTAKKPIRLTVAVAKLVMLGHSQRDAIEALKHVDGNDVHAALDWIAARKRAAA